MKRKRNKFLLILNTVLVLCILAVLLFRFLRKDVEFDCTYGKKPTELLRLIKEEFPVYLDDKDEFDLFATITNEKDNPLIIDIDERMETNK